MKIKYTVLALTLLVVSSYANKPSFDCSKVKKDSSEAIICSSSELTNLDNELAVVYKQALPKASKEDMIRANQRGWIKGRNDCWKAEDEKQCMVDEYKLRIKELKEKYALSSPNIQDRSGSASNGFDKVLKLQGITFHVQATNGGSINQVTIVPSGLDGSNEVMKQKIDGFVTGAEVADLNNDGSPEVYVYVTSYGSGSYGSLVAYSANNKKSLSEIYFAPLKDDKKNFVGYMGHDEFTVVENSFVRRFPIYKKDDSNANPTGGTRQLQYKLLPGEATWQLRLVNSTEF